jgi:uncharacterized protein YecE (DUF72 family)
MTVRENPVLVGQAGWAIPASTSDRFPSTGSSLQRYAAVLPAVEINSSFYRAHKPATYARWAAGVQGTFRFAVKVPKAISHVARLAGAHAQLDAFAEQVSMLGSHLGCLLLQLPPSLAFEQNVAERFFDDLRRRFSLHVVAEPRHASWFADDAGRLLCTYRIARAATDPPGPALSTMPGGWDGLVYYRLHGSPRMYFSPYDPACIASLAKTLLAYARSNKPAWCMFDNTALGHASSDALDLLALVAGHRKA